MTTTTTTTTTSTALMSSRTYEGARGSYFTLKKIFNAKICLKAFSPTTYGWEGEEEIHPVDPTLPVVVEARLNGIHRDVRFIIFTPSGVKYEKVWENSRAGILVQFPYWTKKVDGQYIEKPLIPRWVKELVP